MPASARDWRPLGGTFPHPIFSSIATGQGQLVPWEQLQIRTNVFLLVKTGPISGANGAVSGLLRPDHTPLCTAVHWPRLAQEAFANEFAASKALHWSPKFRRAPAGASENFGER